MIRYAPALLVVLLTAAAAVAPAQAPVGNERDAANGTALRWTPPGVEATLYASEPVLASPTNLDVDRYGRVWVIDVMNYREHGENDERPEGDRILILDEPTVTASPTRRRSTTRVATSTPLSASRCSGTRSS